ncbi:MAG: hypothetical protein CM15mP4_3010 [Candidatus Neomarinimicrobiota bacterium]|nr:MAG: hypothetical protein CM15mP4_3010 [Candidatus Neomarinimicrobiota bacterium]
MQTLWEHYSEAKWYPGWISQLPKLSIDFLKDTEADTALTRAIDAIEFKEPVYVGNCLILKPILSK